MVDDKLLKLTQIYSQMLKKDVAEFEDASQPSRLKRIDDLIQRATELNISEKVATPEEICTDYIELMGAMDQLLELNGFSQFKRHERLNKALDFFSQSPGEFGDYLGMYQEIRDELWTPLVD